jgi:predicted dehydrogenase
MTHMRLVCGKPGVAIVGVYDPDARCSVPAARLVGARRYEHVEVMLDAADPDAVFIFGAPPDRFDERVLLRRVALFVDVPAASDPAQAERWAARADKAGAVTAVNRPLRYVDDREAAKAWLAELRFCFADGRWSVRPSRRPMLALEDAPVDATHILDLALYLLTPPAGLDHVVATSPGAMPQGWRVERTTAWSPATIFVPPRARDAVAPHPAELERLFQRVEPTNGTCLHGRQNVSASFEKLLRRQIDCFLDATNGHGGHIRCTYHDAAQTWRTIQAMEEFATHAAAVAAGAINSDLCVKRAKMVT